MSFPYINAYQQFFDSSGAPLASGTVEFRDPTSNALIDTYPTADDADAQTNANANPLTLNASGAAPTGLFLEDGVKYKVIVKDVNGATIATHDDVLCPIGLPYLQTAAESAAGVTPVNLEYPPGNVLRYGAVGDGVTDDTTAFNNAVLSGHDVIVDGDYLVSSVTVGTACKISGGGIIRKSTVTGTALLSITVDDVWVDNINFIGAGAGALIATTNTADNGILADGVATTSQIDNIRVTNCTFDGFAGCGLRINYATNVWVLDNKIEYCGYAGILLLSVIHGNIARNRINEIDSTTNATSNWYGIALTRDPTKTTAASARSADCIITANIVSNVDQWAGIDTHALNKSQITDNQVYYCAKGIYTQYDSSTETNKQASEDVIIRGNMVEGRPTASENSLGIASLGLAALPNERISIYGNHVIGCGDYNSTNGAIHIDSTDHAEVKHNVLEKSIRVGISIDGTSTYCDVNDNKINGVIAGASSASYMYIDHTSITAISLGRNRMLNDTGNASYDPTQGILYEGSGTEAVFSKNRITDLVGSNYLQKVGGSANIYTDLAWILESESITFDYTATGGTALESTGDKTSSFRRKPATTGTTILNVHITHEAPNGTSYDHGVRGSNGNIYTCGVFKYDLSNVDASAAFTDICHTLEGVYWTD